MTDQILEDQTLEADQVDETDVSDATEEAAEDAVAADEGAESTDGGSLLEEEGDIAADYLEELLDIADLDGDIDIDVRQGRASVEIVADDPDALSVLVGRDGEVLDALQELTRLAVQIRTGDRSRLMLDIAGHRAAYRVQLTELAQAAVAKVQETGKEFSLSPMNAFERKVVHDAVAAGGLVSDSKGVEPNRYVVVQPAS